MIHLGENKYLIENSSELPDYGYARRLFCDFETKSGDPKRAGDYPFKGDRIAGVAVSADEDPRIFYVPLRHGKKNIDLEQGQKWLKRTIGRCRQWWNHNVVFDATFAAKEGATFTGDLVCTLTGAKLIDSDRFGFGLKELAADWFGMPAEEETKLKAYLAGIKSEDYADAPPDIVGLYACGDVERNRRLADFITENLPSEMSTLWRTEINLTAVLFDMQWEGLRIDPTQVKIALFTHLRKMIEISEEIEKIAGREFTNSNTCIYDIFVNQLGLPVLMFREPDEETGEEGSPSFNKKAMALYRVHPTVTADPKIQRLVELVLEYREHSHLAGNFRSWLELVDDNGRIHPAYNQVIRTGRMSCKNPNIQGMNKVQRRFILPDEGCGFISDDYSQIEFRLIVHYIQDAAAIKAYNEDPDTDFHTWVAKMIGVKRKPAKRLNFGMGYGAGKVKVTSELASEPDIIAEIGDKVNELIQKGDLPPDKRSEVFQMLCARRASEAYEQYHETLPGIKRVAKDAQSVCKRRGYVFNWAGRRRHLPPKHSRKAFNAIVQGGAMDIMKDRMVALSPRFNEESRAIGLKVKINVHDEVTSQVPIEHLYDRSLHGKIIDLLQNPPYKFRIPIRCGLGISPNNWGEASGDDTVFSDGTKCEMAKYTGSGTPVGGKLL